VALRHLIPLLIVLCEAGCATAPQPHASFELGDFSGHGRRVLLKGAEVQLCEMHLGQECEIRPEWVGTAQPLLQQALVAELADRGAEVVTDPSAAADYILTVNLKDFFAAPDLVAGRAAFFVLLLPVAIAFGADGMGGGSYSGPFGPSASASLEDATSHELVWQVLYTRGIADVRTSDGARETSRLLLKELPWSQ
jgi:hypothetical protein